LQQQVRACFQTTNLSNTTNLVRDIQEVNERADMSSVYVTEPATEGRVIFETTHGPIDIHLWCRECPATTKLFLQLCLDGFYDNMLFHRIVPSLLIQIGAIRKGSSDDNGFTEEYREAVQADTALQRRRYEINSRIQFSHRGQVAMALGVEEDDDDGSIQPQFFITTEDAPYLDAKHVVFGTLGSGPTIFNAIRICQTETDETTNQPVDLENAPRIVSTKISANPIHTSLVSTPKIPWRVEDSVAKVKRKKRKGKLDVNVLSFGDEMGDVAIISHAKQEKSLAKKAKADEKEIGSVSQETEFVEKSDTTQSPPDRQPELNKEHKVAADMPIVPTDERRKTIKVAGRDTSSSVEMAGSKKANLTKGSSLLEELRKKYEKGKKSKQNREEDTMARLMAFQGKVRKTVVGSSKLSSNLPNDVSLATRMARRARVDGEVESNGDNDDDVAYHGQILESDGEEDAASDRWLKTKFKCRKHIDHTAGTDGRDMDDYEVVDEQKGNSKRDRDERHGTHDRRKRHHKNHQDKDQKRRHR
jgi:peptidyl-prolyl cis-trans isomerase SDCCAG10